MKFSLFLVVAAILLATSPRGFSGVEEVLVNQYLNLGNVGAYPSIQNGLLFRDGKTDYRSSSLIAAIEKCDQKGELNGVNISRGLFHEKEFVRFACGHIAKKKYGHLTNYPDYKWQNDPFTDDEAWRAANNLRLLILKQEEPIENDVNPRVNQ